MEVGIGLSLAFAVLERLRGSIRKARLEKSRVMLDGFEASTEQEHVVTKEIDCIVDGAENLSKNIEKYGAYLSTAAVVSLVYHLILIGFDAHYSYSICSLWLLVILPCLAMPFLVFLIYIVLGIMSWKVSRKVKTYKDAFKLVNDVNKTISLERKSVAKKATNAELTARMRAIAQRAARFPPNNKK